MIGLIGSSARLMAAALGLAVLFGAEAGAAPAKQVSKSNASSRWEMKGSRIIACCCGSPCPCRLNKPPMNCHGCDSTTAVRIDKGTIGKTRMDGVTFAIVGRAYGEKPAENWSSVYVSHKATPEQLKALQGLLEEGGKALGTRAPYIAGKFLGMRSVPMTYTISADRREHRAIISGILDLNTRSIILPGRTKPVVSEGIFDDYGDRFVHAECLAHTFMDRQIGYRWDLTGRQSNQAEFTLSSERVAKGDIGWACCSAHADLGSKDQYQERLVGPDRE